MSLRSPNQKSNSAASLELVGALRGCLRCGVLVVGRSGRIVSCTPDAEHLLELPPGKTVGAPVSLLPPPIRKIIRDVASAHRAGVSRTVTLGTGKNTAILKVNAVPVRSTKSDPCVVIVLNDLDAVKQIEGNLKRLDRLANLGTLSASMAHEIKNALVAVKTFVELLLEKNRESELADVVQREMRRIDSIAGQMLRFAGPARPAFSAVRVHDVLEHSLRLVQPQVEGKLISLNRAFNAAPDAVKGDDYQLEQAFVNLLLNAIEAMGPNGLLTVATDLISIGSTHAAPHVRVAIADTGIGITPENMNRLFEPFFTTKQQGTGLGLTIARRIVQEHHGDITVQSQVNKGTTFNIVLPANAAAR